jgi:uncharacterized membrane protein YraQ (UPF0718 family)
MKEIAITLLVTLLILMALALRQGSETFSLGLRTSLQQLLHFLPALVVAVLITGFVEVLLPKDVVETWLSDASGWRGIALAWLAGIFTPGGSLVGLPLIAALYRAGVGISVLMTYATSFATLSLLRVPIEVGFYGWRLTGLRLLVSLILPIIAGGLTQLLLPLLGR